MSSPPPGWNGDAKKISKLFTFASFEEAMSFMAEIAPFCSRTDHHPEWKNIYNKIWVDLSTHDAGGVTAKDLTLAQHMDETAKRIHSATPRSK